jgi:hypothetical protein
MSLLGKIKSSFSSPKGSTTSHHLVPRKVVFNWQNTPVDWITNQPFASYFIRELKRFLQH